MGGAITGPAIMVHQGGGKPPMPFARLNLKRDFHKITIPRAREKLGRRVFAGEIRKLSIRGERERGITVCRGEVAINIDCGHEMIISAKGFMRHSKMTVVLNPDCELFLENPPIEKDGEIPGGKLAEITFKTREVVVCESIKIYLSRK